MPELVLHIGYPKTGTTAIQRRLLENRIRLADAGILYPSTFIHEYGHHQLPWHLRGDSRRSPGALADLFDSLDAEVRASDPDRVILSSEGFVFGSDPIDVSQHLAARFAPITVVSYLRATASWIESDYNQGVKGHRNLTMSFARFLGDSLTNPGEPLNYARTLGRWADVFGWASLRLRGYSGGDSVADFARLLGLGDLLDSSAPDAPADNPRLGFAGLELLRILNSINPPIAEKQSYYAALAQLTDLRNYRLACSDADQAALADCEAQLLALIPPQQFPEDRAQLAALFQPSVAADIPVMTQQDHPEATTLAPSIRVLLQTLATAGVRGD